MMDQNKTITFKDQDYLELHNREEVNLPDHMFLDNQNHHQL